MTHVGGENGDQHKLGSGSEHQTLLTTLNTDDQLVRRVRCGDVQAYGVLVDRYERGLLAAVLPVVRDVHAAQDVVQDTFVQCYLKLAGLRDASRFGGWLLKVGGRAAVRAASRRRRESHLKLADLPGDDDTAGASARDPHDTTQLLDGDERERLLDHVRRLPAHERAAVTLRYFDGHSVHEIAQITGRPVGTVTKQLSRAVERLRGALATRTESKPCRNPQTHASRMG